MPGLNTNQKWVAGFIYAFEYDLAFAHMALQPNRQVTLSIDATMRAGGLKQRITLGAL